MSKRYRQESALSRRQQDVEKYKNQLDNTSDKKVQKDLKRKLKIARADVTNTERNLKDA